MPPAPPPSPNPAAIAACARGEVFLERGHLEEALVVFSEAIALDPHFALALNNRGNVLMQMRRLPEALDDLTRAASLDPGRAEIQFNLANVLLDLKRHDEALVAYDRAIALKPDLVPAFNNRAQLLLALGRFAEALPVLDGLARLQPNSPQAHFLRGNALYEFSRLAEAVASYDRAIALKPDFAASYANRGNTLSRQGRPEEAFQSYDKAFVLDPNLPYLEGNRFFARLQFCDWADFARERARLVENVKAGRPAAWPFQFLHMADSAPAQRACAQICVREWYPASPDPLWRGQLYDHEKIRIAYVSADFRDHPMPSLMAGVFEAHNRAHFETIAIVLCPYEGSSIQERLKRAFDHFIVVHGQSDNEIAKLIRELEIDIAVDLMGFTTIARTGVFARRPAPGELSRSSSNNGSGLYRLHHRGSHRHFGERPQILFRENRFSA